MEQTQNNTESSPSMFWLIVKIAVVIFIVLLGIKFFSERSEDNSFVERKKTKPKTRKKKDE